MNLEGFDRCRLYVGYATTQASHIPVDQVPSFRVNRFEREILPCARIGSVQSHTALTYLSTHSITHDYCSLHARHTARRVLGMPRGVARA